MQYLLFWYCSNDKLLNIMLNNQINNSFLDLVSFGYNNGCLNLARKFILKTQLITAFF